MSEIYCAAPWLDRMIHWDSVGSCCYLNGPCKENPGTPLWGAWDEPKKWIIDNPYIKNLQERMVNQKLVSICEAKSRCVLRNKVEGFDPNKPIQGFNRISISVTAKCQANCHICRQWRMENPINPNEPNISQIRNLVKFLLSYDIKRVILTGGDPLALTEQKLEAYMQLLRPSSSTHILTNGIGLTAERWDKYFTPENSWISLSLDVATPDAYRRFRGIAGSTSIHNKLRSILKGKDLSRTTIRTTITTGVMREVGLLIEYASELGVPEVMINPVDPRTSCMEPGENIFGRESTNELLDELEFYMDRWIKLGKRLGVKISNLRTVERLISRTRNLIANPK